MCDAPIFEMNLSECRYQLCLPHWRNDYIQGFVAKGRKPYEYKLLQFMSKFLTTNDLFIDVGANIGNHSLFLSASTGCRVVAIEPNPELCAAVRESIKINGLERKVELVEKGVGRSADRAFFKEYNPSNIGAQSLTFAGHGREVVGPEIEVTTIDSLNVSTNVRMIKIDVEGMEEDVVLGAMGVIQRDHPILFIEAGDSDSFNRLSALLRPLGYFYWETFNATPTHCFMHDLDVQRVNLRDRSYFYGQLVYRNRDRLHEEMNRRTIIRNSSLFFLGEKTVGNVADPSWIRVTTPEDNANKVQIRFHAEEGISPGALKSMGVFFEEVVRKDDTVVILGLESIVLKEVLTELLYQRCGARSITFENIGSIVAGDEGQASGELVSKGFPDRPLRLSF